MRYRLGLGLLVLIVGFALVEKGWAGDLGFLETFALSDDRAKALSQLLPGTEDYYYYHALHDQNTGEYDKVETLLPLWIQRYSYTPRVWEILNRQALLTYPQNPQKSLEYLRNKLGLHFHHARKVEEAPSYPTSLDPQLYDRQNLIRAALQRYDATSLYGITDEGLRDLDPKQLSWERRREWLSRLRYPDVDDLASLVAADLTAPRSNTFGSLPIHPTMTLAQLKELRQRLPDLISNPAFIETWIQRLSPGPEVDGMKDPDARGAYLESLWAFAQDLPPLWNSLKAHLLYHLLHYKRSQGIYDKALFLTYLALPRPLGYVNPALFQSAERMPRQHWVNLSETFPFLPFPPIGQDEPLVRDFLMHLLAKEDRYHEYLPWIREDYLQKFFAETKILLGMGDPERWYSLLTPEEVKELQERVEINLVPQNKTRFLPGEPVTIEADIKNVPTLRVRVYRINTVNWYRAEKRPIPLDIDLDGLVSNDESLYSYSDPPTRRVRRSFSFPHIQDRGVYVIDFVGNGVSSRALVQIGTFRLLRRSGASGHILTVLDESNRPLSDATLIIQDHEYLPDAEGKIRIPFAPPSSPSPSSSSSTREGREFPKGSPPSLHRLTPLIIRQGDFATFETFEHQQEIYHLTAGFYVDRESLLAGETAKLLIRPSLRVGSTPIPISLLQKPVLTLIARDFHDVLTTRTIRDLALRDDAETVVEFRVPSRTVHLSFVLQGEVEFLTGGEKIELSTKDELALNEIYTTLSIAQLLLQKTASGYRLHLLGKNGEPLPKRPVQLRLFHPSVRDAVEVTLQTDAEGVVTLGSLEGLAAIEATTGDGVSARWSLRRQTTHLPPAIHAPVGTPIRLAISEGEFLSRTTLGLLRRSGKGFREDLWEKLHLHEGILEIDPLEPDDYLLVFHKTGEVIPISVTQGEMIQGWILGANRLLELAHPPPLHIQPTLSDPETIAFEIRGADAATRIHLIATRFVPPYDPVRTLGEKDRPSPLELRLPYPESIYESGRAVGDETRYILERREQKKFPGNMLKRPGLLLIPWSLEETISQKEAERPEGTFSRRTGGGPGAAIRRVAESPIASQPVDTFATLDFLASPSLVFSNLRPDANGKVILRRKDLGGRTHLHLVAIKRGCTVYRELALDPVSLPKRDLRFARGFDPAKHLFETKAIRVLKAGEELPVLLSEGEWRIYATLRDVWQLYLALSGDATLREFEFITRWPALSEAEKRELYSRYASHELHLFLYQKDRPFFDTFVKPYLAHKKEKQFLDRWLLGEDLRKALEPWAFGQLNLVEKILLGKRIAEVQASIARWVCEQAELIPPDPHRFDYLFQTAIKAASLEFPSKFQEARENAEGKGEEPLLAAIQKEEVSIPERAEWDGEKQKAKDRGEKKRARLVEARRKTLKGELPPPVGAVPPPPSLQALPTPSGSTASELALAEDTASPPLEAPLPLRDQEEQERQEEVREAEKDLVARSKVRRFYREVGPTKAWMETHYYRLPSDRQNPDLIPPNAFWTDFAKHREGPFVSPHIAECGRGFTEMMFALSLLDLPFEASASEGSGTDFRILFHKEMRELKPKGDAPPILVGQNLFRADDRYHHEENRKIEKYVTGDLLAHVVYGCHVVVTNPTSQPRRLEVLLQIPQGAMPVQRGYESQTLTLTLAPYETKTFDSFFYFPTPGQYPHFPVHVAEEGNLVAFASGERWNVVESLQKVDTTSWPWISQNGDLDAVLRFLEEANLARLDLEALAWRMRDRKSYEAILSLLRKRHVFHPTLASYALLHNDPATIRCYLEHREDFVRECGLALDSPLLSIEPVARKGYQHVEFDPLVHARAHKFGSVRKILHPRLFAQYETLLRILTYRQKLDDEENLTLAYYLFLQDRIEEALERLGRVHPEKLPTRLQYDYFTVYADFYRGDLLHAKSVAERYVGEKIDPASSAWVARWHNLFRSALEQIREVEGGLATLVDPESREEVQTQLASTEPALDFTLDGKTLRLQYQNLDQVTLNLYRMDVELLFSRSPFQQEGGSRFSFVQPTASMTILLKAERKEPTDSDGPSSARQSSPPSDPSASSRKNERTSSQSPRSTQTTVQSPSPPSSSPQPEREACNAKKEGILEIPLPEAYWNENVMVEIVGGGKRRAIPYLAHAMHVILIPNYGQLSVSDAVTRTPLATVYGKVYAKMRGGEIRFWKDGYTDLRGRFDYATVSDAPLQDVEKFAILLLSESHGSVIREVDPPQP